MANTTIQIKSSGVTGNVPSTLSAGEIAINFKDGKLYYGNTLNQVTLLETASGPAAPAGLHSEIQINVMGALGSDSDFRYLSSNNTLLVQTINLDGKDVNNSLVSSFDAANVATQYAQSSGNYANSAFSVANTISDISIAMAIALG